MTKHEPVLTAVEIAECLPESAHSPAEKNDQLAFIMTVDELKHFASLPGPPTRAIVRDAPRAFCLDFPWIFLLPHLMS